MRTDVGLPIEHGETSRDETLIVYFDGFIKNQTEGVIRTMIRESDTWLEKYPKLSDFVELSQDEIYDTTMLFSPTEFLFLLAEEKKPLEEIEDDLELIMPEVIFDNSKITTFEFSLYQLLKQKFLKKCYIFKDDDFYENEVAYIQRQYKDVISKIEFVSGGFLSLFEEVDPTTIFLLDSDLVFNYISKNYPPEKIVGTVFILLNTAHNVDYNDNTKEMLYSDEFVKKMEIVNEEELLSVSSMFNFRLSLEDDNDIEEDEDDE